MKILQQSGKNVEGLGKLFEPVKFLKMLIVYFFVHVLCERNVGLGSVCPLVNAVLNLKRIR
jgi:hypothetical protein